MPERQKNLFMVPANRPLGDKLFQEGMHCVACGNVGSFLAASFIDQPTDAFVIAWEIDGGEKAFLAAIKEALQRKIPKIAVLAKPKQFPLIEKTLKNETTESDISFFNKDDPALGDRVSAFINDQQMRAI